MGRHTKIIATLGPAVASADGVDELVEAGIDAARLNFSHGDHESHRRFAQWVRAAAKRHDRPIALLQDVQGPKIRVGTFAEGRADLLSESVVELVPGSDEGSAKSVFIDYPFLLDDLDEGDAVLLADGRVRLRVESRSEHSLKALVVEGGQLSDHCGAAFPETSLRVPALTGKDIEDLEFGRTLDVDYVAASFVRSANDILQVKAHTASGTPIIAKVELASAYTNLDDILSAAEAIMVARGDLGVELPLEQIPVIQQDVLTRTNAAGLLSITATEMLESMIHSSRPTRAEVTDIATAVQSGSDAVMLSAETAVGDFPAKAVRYMSLICAEAERSRGSGTDGDVAFLASHRTFSSAAAKAAVESAQHLDLGTIVAFTESGSTARLVSKYRPRASIVAFTPRVETFRRMALYWGVQPRLLDREEHTDDLIAAADRYLLEQGMCEPGDGAVMVAGTPPNRQESTNLMKLHVVGRDL